MHCPICHSKALQWNNVITICLTDRHPSYDAWNHSDNIAGMVKNGRRITFGMQTDISVESAHSEIAVTATHIPRKKIGRMTNIGIVIGIIEGGVVTTIDDLQTITEDSIGLVQTETIVSIRTGAIMTKVQRTAGVKSHVKNTVNNPGITCDFSITRMNKQYRRKLIHLR